ESGRSRRLRRAWRRSCRDRTPPALRRRRGRAFLPRPGRAARARDPRSRHDPRECPRQRARRARLEIDHVAHALEIDQEAELALAGTDEVAVEHLELEPAALRIVSEPVPLIAQPRLASL